MRRRRSSCDARSSQNTEASFAHHEREHQVPNRFFAASGLSVAATERVAEPIFITARGQTNAVGPVGRGGPLPQALDRLSLRISEPFPNRVVRLGHVV